MTPGHTKQAYTGPINQFIVGKMTDEDYWARLIARITVTEAGCWECAGFQHIPRGTKTVTKGYVSYSVRGKPWPAHRWTYTQKFGPIPEGLGVCHKCDNPSCCNPDHLFLGTDSENAIDRIAKKRDRNRSRTHCIRGHELAGDNLRIRPTLRGFRRQCITCDRLRLQSPENVAKASERQRRRRAHQRTNRNMTDDLVAVSK